MRALLEIQQLSKAFGGLQAVYNLSFQAQQGEIIGLMGPNGAGKTTVFHLIMGALKPDGGRIYFKGEDITGHKTYQIVNLGIARAFQMAQCCPGKTVWENLELCACTNRLWSWKRRDASLLLQVAEQVGLVPELEKLPAQLPQAGLRRLEVARAIATSPELLLLDEPFAGLTASEVAELSLTIQQLRSQGMTIVLVDHNVRGLMRLVDRVLVMSFGQLIAEGIPSDIVKDPKVRQAYFGQGGS
jgi:branched-chain amino acid transport system ATP-binding protein